MLSRSMSLYQTPTFGASPVRLGIGSSPGRPFSARPLAYTPSRIGLRFCPACAGDAGGEPSLRQLCTRAYLTWLMLRSLASDAAFLAAAGVAATVMVCCPAGAPPTACPDRAYENLI